MSKSIDLFKRDVIGNLITSALLFSVFFSCKQRNIGNESGKTEMKGQDSIVEDQKVYVLHGNIKNLKSDSVIITKFIGDSIALDFVKVTKGLFIYSDSIITPYFIQIDKFERADPVNNNGSKEFHLLTGGKLAEFIVEPGTIYIQGTSDLLDSIKVSGSYSDSLLKEYFMQDKLLQDKWDRLKINYDAARKQSDNMNAKQIAAQLNDINKNERVSLLKRYVTKYKGNIVGSLLPLFCTLQEYLTKSDYFEMYNSLTDDMKLTDYGKSVLGYSK